VRGMEACKSEQEGLKREKEEKLYASLEGLKVELDAYRKRTSTLDGEPTFTGPFAFEISRSGTCRALQLQLQACLTVRRIVRSHWPAHSPCEGRIFSFLDRSHDV